MPTYDYHCNACDQNFEYFQSMKDDPLKTCLLCGKNDQVERLISPGAGFIFKGSGFYTTDYRSKEYQKKAKAEKDLSSSKPKSDESSTKSKESKKTSTPNKDK